MLTVNAEKFLRWNLVPAMGTRKGEVVFRDVWFWTAHNAMTYFLASVNPAPLNDVPPCQR